MSKRTFSIIVFLFCILLNTIYAWKPLFIGHRGGYTGVQNTVESYTNGVTKYGYQGLECDVRVTKDGEYVICHDETTSSLGGSLTVASATLAQLKAEKLTQTRGGVTYTGQICTVAEYLAICKKYDVIPVIELKWTTGINSNSMTNFPGLYKLVAQYSLLDKVVFLTSMKPSLEYIRTNYPKVKCQFLTGEYWANHFDWCVKWGINPSIQAGYFDEETVNKFHKAGLEVAVWTVNTQDNYTKYGKWGVYMITCDYLYKDKMPELPDKDWGDILPLEASLNLLYSNCLATNNLPEGFPSSYAGDNSNYKSAYQATAIDGIVYSNDCNTSTLLQYKIKTNTLPMANVQGTSSYGLTSDDANNLIMRDDNNSDTPSKLVIYKYGTEEKKEISFSLNHNGKTNFISASGDVFSQEGGYVYFYPNGQSFVDIVKICNGEFVETTSSDELSTTGANSLVIPIANNPQRFYYQSRNKGIYFYDNADKGMYIEVATTKAPLLNITGGGVAFTLDGHELLLYPSGTNYNGGFSIKDISAYKSDLLSAGEIGTKGIKGNQSYSSFFKVEKISDKTVHIYEYCMGNGIALYELTTDKTAIKEIQSQDKLRIVPISSNSYKIISPNAYDKLEIYRLSGAKVMDRTYKELNNEHVLFLSSMTEGLYIIKIGNQSVKIKL